jgi:hypothetical protein
MFSNSRTFVLNEIKSVVYYSNTWKEFKNLLTIYYTETKYKKERGSK